MAKTKTKRPMSDPATITPHEAEQVHRANATGLTPVVFIHGLWLLPSSWDRWAVVFEKAGYTALTRRSAIPRCSRTRRWGRSPTTSTT